MQRYKKIFDKHSFFHYFPNSISTNATCNAEHSPSLAHPDKVHAAKKLL